jgi:hypothetical protein
MISLTESRTDFREQSLRKTRAFGVAAILCLVLMALLAMAQVAHVHSIDSDADHCPLCIALHPAAPAAVLVATVVLVRIQAAAPVFKACPVQRYWRQKLFIRPPPEGC